MEELQNTKDTLYLNSILGNYFHVIFISALQTWIVTFPSVALF